VSRPRHRAVARAASAATLPPIYRDPDLLHSFLSDAAHVPGGTADGVVFPRDVAEIAAVVRAAKRVLPVGAQSSLTGGADTRRNRASFPGRQARSAHRTASPHA